jgi:hypothetical protein
MPFVQNEVRNSRVRRLRRGIPAPSHDPIELPSEKRLSMDDTEEPFAIGVRRVLQKGLFFQSWRLHQLLLAPRSKIANL